MKLSFAQLIAHVEDKAEIKNIIFLQQPCVYAYIFGIAVFIEEALECNFSGKTGVCQNRLAPAPHLLLAK